MILIGSIILSTVLFVIAWELKDIGKSLYKISRHLERIDERDKS